LKAPGQHTGRPYTAPFNSILSSDLIRAALRGDVRSAGEVEQWLDQHRLNYLPGPGLAPATMAEATN
jgi:hypothetical protein